MSVKWAAPHPGRQRHAGLSAVPAELPSTRRFSAKPRRINWLRVGLARWRSAYVEGYGTCIGDPELRAGTLVEIEGLGKRFSGSYYVTSTEHSYRPEFRLSHRF